MKKLLLLVLLCVGCTKPVTPPRPPEPMPCPPPSPACSDGMAVYDETSLKENVVCPPNTRLVFPSSVYFGAGKVLVLCQCK